MSEAKRILVLGCGGSPGVNFIKALRLSKEKFYIVGVDVNKYFLEISPVDSKYYLPHPKVTKGYIDSLIKIIQKERIDFVHAQPDEEVKIISDCRNLLPAKTLLPSKNAVDIFQDKWLTYKSLLKAGIPVAKTYKVGNQNNLRKIISGNKKPLWIRASRGAGGKASLPIKNFEQAKIWIDYWSDKGVKRDDFLIGEFLPGREVSWLSLWKEGKVICSQQKERMGWVQGNISPSGVGGTTALQKTSSYENVNRICTETVLTVDRNANGIYTIDTKENFRGIPCVTEINPGRFFTTSLFFATAGVNMPLLLVKLALNLPIPKVKQYNPLADDIYWIRVIDGNTSMMKDNQWTYKTI